MRSVFGILIALTIIGSFSSCTKIGHSRQSLLLSLDIDVASFNRLSDFDKTNIIRKQISKLGNRPLRYDLEASFEKVFPQSNELPTDQIITTLKDEDYYFMTCGSLSYLLRDVYRAFGWQSCTYNFGIENTIFTHEVTLVSSNNNEIWYQDPYFNSTLAKDGQPVDFLDFLEKIKYEKYKSLFYEDSTIVDLIFTPSDTLKFIGECSPEFLGENMKITKKYGSVDFLVYQPLNLYDSCGGFMIRLNTELDTLLRYENLFLNRISEMQGQENWQRKVDQVLGSP